MARPTRPELTTVLIPSIRRATLERATRSCENHPYIVQYDDNHEGAGETRRKLVEKAKTEWVSFLDDDDSLTSDYWERLEEETAKHPEAGIIYFRAYKLDSGILFPAWPEISWGNGIYYSVKRDLALKYPFRSEPEEDQGFIRRMVAGGAKIHWSKYITYRIGH